MAAKEWSRGGSFVKKPTTGWLHDDAALSHGDGVYYPVKYVGRIPCNLSMRDMGFEERTAITREAITLCCEMSGLRAPRKRKVTKTIKECLSSDPVKEGIDIKLTISTTGIALVTIQSNSVVANHIMPNISFATGGEAEDYDLIGYVAKDARGARDIHVFDCGHMAHDIIATLGQAFELRFKQFLAKGNHTGQAAKGSTAPSYDEAGYRPSGAGMDALYADLPAESTYGDHSGGGHYDLGSGGGRAVVRAQDPATMYDYGSGYGSSGTPAVRAKAPTSAYDNAAGRPNVFAQGSTVYGDEGEDEDTESPYDNAGKSGPGYQFATDVGYLDPVDPQQYDSAGGAMGGGGQYGLLPEKTGALPDYDDDMMGDATKLTKAPGGAELGHPLREEVWFHGKLRREDADKLLRRDGDFLVRESTQTKGQFVLSALQQGSPKHLLLVDPAGRVRTKDMTFDSVSHLINYHIRARIPIISRGSRVLLGDPVPRRGDANVSEYDTVSRGQYN